MKKVLLLGDSIRLSYQPLVREKLEGTAEVMGPEDNGRFAKYTLWYINVWLDEFGRPDIVHWNNGLWDVYHFHNEMGIFTPLEEYVEYIKRILKELRRTGAEIIWATTTPVDNRNVNCNNNEIDMYNDAIASYMAAEKVTINDLNSIVKKSNGYYICEDRMHLNEEGRIVCSEAVVRAIKKYL